LNARSVIVALVVYCQIILVRNVLAGLDSIDPAILEAARGMGMNSWQIAWRVQLPLALPVILAGMRIAGVVAVAIATVGAKFGAGGLGTLLFDGIAQAGRTDKILTGGLLVGVLAFLLNRALLALEHRFTPQIQAPRRPA
jgi:osmoprotectant transport system permease protein